ncbi:hypothetical protein [Knoellia sp. LjRoot47]|uniref:hypothetical protein n=1 Tax=Knoellia sp. LjRoot47 TaxID=3342330 RepID=UPI003ECFF009
MASETVDQVRLIIADTDSSNQLLDDSQIASFLALTGGNVRLAAADALEAIAVSEVLVAKKIQTQHLQTDGPAVAESLRKLAATQRQLARDEADAGDEGFFDVVDTISDGSGPEHTNRPVWGL